MTKNKKMLIRLTGLSKFRRRKYQWFRALGSGFQSCFQKTLIINSQKVCTAILFLFGLCLKVSFKKERAEKFIHLDNFMSYLSGFTKKGGGFYQIYVFEEFSSNRFNSISSSLVISRYFPVGTSNLIFIILTRFNDLTLQPKDSHILLI